MYNIHRVLHFVNNNVNTSGNVNSSFQKPRHQNTSFSHATIMYMRMSI